MVMPGSNVLRRSVARRQAAGCAHVARTGKEANMKLAIIGTGMIVNMVEAHLEEWGCDVTAVCGTPHSIDRAREIAAAHNAAAYDDYDELLFEADIDAVYIAVPNFLHHGFAKKALAAGRHVIVEKPMTSTYDEAAELAALAREKGLLLYEAISTVYLPNYAKIRELLPRIGQVKLVTCNYSQYSSRYDAFRAGQVLPAFDPAKSGGALMDLGLYNLHYLLGLFGEPEAITYSPNIERGIDTSGVAVLDYGGFHAVSVAAKDCAAPACYTIQGTEGYIMQATPANNCGPVTLHLNDGTEETFSLNPGLQWESEFRAFAAGIATNDLEGCYKALDHSLAVSRTMTSARLAAGIRFAADEKTGE